MFILDKDKSYQKETESKVVIRFQDCDPLKHLNNAKYFDYFFNAREDQVPRLYDLQMVDFHTVYKATWVVYNHQISYIKPAIMGEWVRIMSRLIWYNENTILLEYYMTDESKKQLKTLLWSTMRYVKIDTGKSTPHEGMVLDFLKATLLPDIHIPDSGFMDRIRQLKNELIYTV